MMLLAHTETFGATRLRLVVESASRSSSRSRTADIERPRANRVRLVRTTAFLNSWYRRHAPSDAPDHYRTPLDRRDVAGPRLI